MKKAWHFFTLLSHGLFNGGKKPTSRFVRPTRGMDSQGPAGPGRKRTGFAAARRVKAKQRMRAKE